VKGNAVTETNATAMSDTGQLLGRDELNDLEAILAIATVDRGEAMCRYIALVEQLDTDIAAMV